MLDSVAAEAKLLGLHCGWIAHENNPTSPGALKASLLATVSTKSPLITFVCHADTVFPENSPFQKLTWSADRKRASGPGVIDDKGGILVALLVLEKLAALTTRNFSVQLICMPTEEVGSPGFHPFLSQAGRDSALILGFEPALNDGSIVYSRRGNRWIEMKMTGPGGHAGRDAGKVNNPLTQISEKLTALSKLSDPTKSVSVTPGSLSTNTTGFNVIPSEVIARVDIRYNDNDSRDALHAKVLPWLAETEWTCAEDCPAMPLNPESIDIAKKAIALIEQIEGRKVTVQQSHGSSDCNYAARAGIPIVDSLGPVGSGIHTLQEEIIFDTIFSRAEVVSKLIQQLF